MSDAKTPNPTIVSGRFRPGNKAAAGRTSRGQKLRAAVLASISRDDVEAITKTLIAQAIGGDLGAAKILLGFIGKCDSGPGVAIQVNSHAETSCHEPGRVAGIAEHSPEPVAPKDLETMRAEIMGRIARARDAVDSNQRSEEIDR